MNSPTASSRTFSNSTTSPRANTGAPTFPTSTTAIEPDHFFKALKSQRRLANITSLNDLLAGPMKQRITDPYAQCAELDDRDIYAVDGHYHHAACFDKKSEDSKGELRAIATGHFFRMNLPNHHMSCLGMANP